MRTFRPGMGHAVLYGISAKEIADWCGVTTRTARRWKRGEDPPQAAIEVIELRSTGNLGVVDQDWRGWKIREGKLISPDGIEFTSGDVLSLTFLRQLIAHYQSEQRVPRQSDWISERWEPATAVNE